MPTAQSLSQPQDVNGASYPAMRVAFVHGGVLTANTSAPFALLPQTKVVRVCGVTDVYVQIGLGTPVAVPASSALVSAAHYQDFVVYPGESVAIISIPGGMASVTELA